MECCFKRECSGCRILTVEKCPTNCSFRKTKDEYVNSRYEAEEKLTYKGLQPVIVEKRGRKIMTVQKIKALDRLKDSIEGVEV